MLVTLIILCLHTIKTCLARGQGVLVHCGKSAAGVDAGGAVVQRGQVAGGLRVPCARRADEAGGVGEVVLLAALPGHDVLKPVHVLLLLLEVGDLGGDVVIDCSNIGETSAVICS